MLPGVSQKGDLAKLKEEVTYTDKFELVGPYIRNEGSYKASLIRIVQGDKGYRCIVCSFKMDNIYNLKKHFKKIHPIENKGAIRIRRFRFVRLIQKGKPVSYRRVSPSVPEVSPWESSGMS